MRYVKAVRVILLCSVGVVGRPARRGRLRCRLRRRRRRRLFVSCCH